MNDITNINTNSLWGSYDFLNEFINNSIKTNIAIAHFEWDDELSILSYNDSAKTILTLNHVNQSLNKLTDIVPLTYLSQLNEHIHNLQANEHNLSVFSYKVELYEEEIKVIWLSTRKENKILTVCYYLQSDIITGDSLTNLLRVISTPALVLNQKGEYISCNNLMLNLLDIPKRIPLEGILGNKLGTIGENPNLCKYLRTIIGLAKPNLIKEIQTTFNLNTGNRVYYLFSYCKYNTSIVIVGIDITNVKVLERDLLALEEKCATILKILPDIMKELSLRSKDNNVDILTDQLTKDSIFTSLTEIESNEQKYQTSDETSSKIKDLAVDKDLYSNLIRLEVETKEINVRLKQVETLLFLEHTSLLNRMKAFEISNETLTSRIEENVGKINEVNKHIENLKIITKIINNTPGNLKGVITISMVFLTLLIALITYFLDTTSLKTTIDSIHNPSTLLKP